MKFRHHKGVRLALTSGHVTFVGPEWRELAPMFYMDALAKGCQCDQQVTPEPPEPEATMPKPSPDAVVNTDEVTVIRAALIKMIERNSEGESDDFTQAGMPNLNTLRKEAGISIDKELAYRIFKDLKAEAEASGGAGE
jgi:hypothetical protein